jgi:hypothetical protein
MQHIRTAISNLHPAKTPQGLELTEVSFVWGHNGERKYRIQGRGEADEPGRVNERVGDSLKAMMVRGG